MPAYPTGTRLKLGLIVFALAIAAASLLFTWRLADRLQAQDEAAVQLWANAIEFQGRISLQGNPFAAELAALDSAVAAGAIVPPGERRERLRDALTWAENQPGGEGLDFVFSEIVQPGRFSVPALITDSAFTYVAFARNVEVDSSRGLDVVQAELLALAREMDETNPPIRFEFAPGNVQFVHYGESALARTIRAFPLVQLLVVGLFILVGYLGFSYLRRSEQSMLWVGMAKEAAHQLGTPLSSMIGWIELLRLGDAAPADRIASELETDVDRLRRVADRFEKIGSRPDLEPVRLAPVLESVADYMRRRIPTSGDPVELTTEVGPDLAARLNPDLFEWVIENLLKNALDAMEGGGGRISLRARREGDHAIVDVQDTGKGMDRATARLVFKPGFSTKRRGWGLGLSLARRIVEEYHGGRLEVVSSRPGEGTTFRITLAAADPVRLGTEAEEAVAGG
ncbi:MAG: HAMP domain-containing sensor histidine kinase [Bacteroidota bacterium]